ncbi:MAG: ABC transporter ATP-binding protein [Anaerolineae bacterium]
MGEMVIETKDLTKRYGKFVAVDALNLTAEKGEIYGLLGPNGSGKTTTILMLLGLTEPSAGQVRVLGFDPVRQPLSVKKRVGYLPDQVGFYDGLTARENLTYIAKLNRLPRQEAAQRIESVIAQMGLTEVIDHRVGTFSRGMRQRLGVAELLLKRPQIIIMDEPTLGLDPEAARTFLQTIRDLKQAGITILLASHLLPQVQEVCDRVGLFYRGRIVLEGTVNELAQRVLGGAYRVRLQADGAGHAVEEALRSLAGVVNLQCNGSDRFVLEANADLRAEAADAVVKAGGKLKALDIEAPSLDEIYAQYFAQYAKEVEHGAAA